MFEHTRHVVVKVTRDCNLRCKYCYVADKDKYKGEVMPFSIFKDLVNRIVEDKLKASTENEKVQFTLHGGEPTIVGSEVLHKFLDYVSYIFSQNKISYSIGIQTNATLLTDEILQLFHDYNVDVGISFDGIGKSNSQRNHLPIQNYISTIKRLKEYNLNFGTIVVVSPANINYTEKNINFFKKIGLGGKFNYAEDVFNLGNCEVPGEDFFEKVFIPLYNEYGKPQGFKDSSVELIVKGYFENRLAFLQRGTYFNYKVDHSLSICQGLFCGAGKLVVEVSPDGSVNLCGRYDKDAPYCNIGSIYSTDFLGLFSLKNYMNHMEQKRKTIDELKCDFCEASSFCDHGCMAFHYVKNHTWGVRTDLVCTYYKKIAVFLTTHEKEALLKYLKVSSLRDRVDTYLYVGAPVTPSLIENIKEYLRGLGLVFSGVEKDSKWKSQDGESYQVLIKGLRDVI